MIRIITIDRECGSGAADIAAKLAARLGLKLWDELPTIEIARITDCPVVEEREERRDSLRYKLFNAFLRGIFEGILNAQRVKLLDADCIREISEKVMRKAAGECNCAIVGRVSAYHLQSKPDAFHVFVYAGFKKRSGGCAAWAEAKKRPTCSPKQSTRTGPRTSGTTSSSSGRPVGFTTS
jgi:uncharacterized protein